MPLPAVEAKRAPSGVYRRPFDKNGGGRMKGNSQVLDKPIPHLLICTKFFSTIGLPWKWQPGASGLVAGIEIGNGVWMLDPGAPASLREMLNAMLRKLDEIGPDAPLAKAIIQSSEPEATTWAWAAGMHIGLKPKTIISASECNAGGDYIRSQQQMNAIWPPHALVHTRFCVPRPRLEAALGLPAHLKLARWLQKDFWHAESNKRPQGGTKGLYAQVPPAPAPLIACSPAKSSP